MYMYMHMHMYMYHNQSRATLHSFGGESGGDEDTGAA